MKLYSYVVARDYGFAPNPFYSFCTLATCKPLIRKSAVVGDWIVGTGSAKAKKSGQVVFCMQVNEALSFSDYWKDDRFQRKKPNLCGSLKQAYGDNIYTCETPGSDWHQADSHHSLIGGRINEENLVRDTQTDRMLLSTNYKYYGKDAIEIPAKFRDFDTYDLCATRGHKCIFPEEFVSQVVEWLLALPGNHYCGEPDAWRTEI